MVARDRRPAAAKSLRSCPGVGVQGTGWGKGVCLRPDPGESRSLGAAPAQGHGAWSSFAFRHRRVYWAPALRESLRAARWAWGQCSPMFQSVSVHLSANRRHFITRRVCYVPTKVEILKGRDEQ